ncbi:thiol:disulfide interchange protein [Chromatiales bacterium (ex Bugula neritina AB1)]|nr:thiol:disulfide interchange protein [Chromatiales bacterium (ex Bugula neritina AB1)]
MRFALPLLVFLLIGGFLYTGLNRDPRYVPSPLIGKPAPEFTLPTLADASQTFSPSQMVGKVWLFNIWGTWCVACRAEHPVLVQLAQSGQVDIVGLNYKDDKSSAITWLQELGDPYITTAVDADGRTGIDWGFYGAPETFVVDKKGLVRHKHIGPVSPKDLSNTILPLVAELRAEAG